MFLLCLSDTRDPDHQHEVDHHIKMHQFEPKPFLLNLINFWLKTDKIFI